jgi:hypothetical protein
MAYSVVPTVATGDLWTAANHNTYIRDNLSALWPYTTAGDLSYASSATVLARLGIGSAYGILSSSGSAPVWRTLADILQIGVSGTISTNTSSTSFTDISGSSFSMTLNRTSHVFALLFGTITCSAAESEYIKIAIGASESSEILELMNNDYPRNVMALHYVSSVAAGAVTIKAQYKSLGGVQVNFYNGKLYGFAIPRA